MWQLETGQAYKKYNVSSPTDRIKLEYKIHRGKRNEQKISQTASATSGGTSGRSSSIIITRVKFKAYSNNLLRAMMTSRNQV